MNENSKMLEVQEDLEHKHKADLEAIYMSDLLNKRAAEEYEQERVCR